MFLNNSYRSAFLRTPRILLLFN